MDADGRAVAWTVAKAADCERDAERVGREHRYRDALDLRGHHDVGLGLREERRHAVAEQYRGFGVEYEVAVVDKAARQISLGIGELFGDFREERAAVFRRADGDEARAAAAAAVDHHLSEALGLHRGVYHLDVVAYDGL